MAHPFCRLAWAVPSLVLLVAFIAVGTPGVRAQATPVPAPDNQYTPLLPSVLSPPRWFRGADEQIHLVYELMLTNAFPVPVEISTLEVVDADSGDVVGTLTGEALTAAMSLLISPSTPATSLPAGTVGVVWMDVVVPDAELLPAIIQHRLTVTVPPGLPVPRTITETGGAARVDLRPPVVLGPPLAGARWVAVGSCCDGPHRRAMQAINGELYLAQRFAIDFNRLDADYRTEFGDPSLNTSAPGYGQPVLAVADATVVAATDRYPDQIPGAPTGVTLENAEGNHVILDLGDGRYALYAHLKPGSVNVQEGERVQQGQVIGELGNSGSSTGPHLHFHVMDAPSGLVADGVPYVFADFELTGTVPPLAELLELDQAQEPVPVDTRGEGPRHDALPLGRDMVAFPDVGAAG
jgi:Peptidase family M23